MRPAEATGFADPCLTLTIPDLENLTGYKTRSRQQTWLQTEGVPFRVDHRGRIIVASEHVKDWVRGVELRPSSGPRLDLVT